MSDLVINAWDNEIELDIFESKLYPHKNPLKLNLKAKLWFLFTGELIINKLEIDSIFVRIEKKGGLHFLSEIIRNAKVK